MKMVLFQTIQFSQPVIIQIIQFSFVCKQLNVKTVLYQTNQFSVSTFSMSKTVPFQKVQFSISTQFKCKYGLIVKNISNYSVLIQTIQFSMSMQLVLFNPLIGPYQVQPFRARVDLGAMAMKGCFAFTKAPASL